MEREANRIVNEAMPHLMEVGFFVKMEREANEQMEQLTRDGAFDTKP